MRSLVPKLLTAAVVLVAALVWVPAAIAAPTFSGAFKLTSSEALNTNTKIVAGPDGNVWFTVQTAGKDVAKITPSGAITEYALEGIEGGTGIAVAEGKLWIPTINAVTSFSPGDPEGTKHTFTIASIASGGQIASGPGGELWVASLNNLTHFVPSDPENKNGSFTPVGAFTPLDIDAAGTGLVIADFGHKRLVTVNSKGEQGPDIPLGGETAASQGVAGNPDGQIAFSKSDNDEGLGLVTPPAAPTAVLMPGDPFGVTLGADGNYWFAMSAAHGIEQLTPTGQATALAFPGFEKWFPRQIAAGPGGTLWVTMEVPGGNEYAIALVSGVELPPTPSAPTGGGGSITVTEKPVPNTTFGKGPKKVVKTTGAKATVKFTFSASVAGSTFQCRLTKVTIGKKAKASRSTFAGCRSPKVLKLAPGKYRFAVRAVAAGVLDGSPAEKTFRVVRTPRHR